MTSVMITLFKDLDEWDAHVVIRLFQDRSVNYLCFNILDLIIDEFSSRSRNLSYIRKLYWSVVMTSSGLRNEDGGFALASRHSSDDGNKKVNGFGTRHPPRPFGFLERHASLVQTPGFVGSEMDHPITSRVVRSRAQSIGINAWWRHGGNGTHAFDVQPPASQATILMSRKYPLQNNFQLYNIYIYI